MTNKENAAPPKQYLDFWNSHTGKKALIQRVEPRKLEDGPALALTFADFPQPGYVTGVTYGLSLARPDSSEKMSRELITTMRSNDSEWAVIPARMVAALRGLRQFEHGEAIGHKRPYIKGSSMSGLLLAEPPNLFDSSIARIPITQASGTINIEMIGAYPIHPSERDYVWSNGGFDALWKLRWDRFDPARDPIV